MPATLVRGAVCVALALQAGCTPLRPPPAPATPPPAAALEDESYDWRALVSTPFGTEFAALHAGLHEVILFRDAAPGPAANAPSDALDADDCYRSKTPGPRFVGRVAADYLWCFSHDRLDRISAVVHLPSTEAPDLFARYCARWLVHADDAQHTALRCAGRDGGLAFSAQLQAPGPDSATDLAIVVYAAREQ